MLTYILFLLPDKTFYMTRQLCFWIILLCIAVPVRSQLITSIPEMLVSKQEPFVGTSFFIPDSNKIMVLHKGEAKFYSVDGREAGKAISGFSFIYCNSYKYLFNLLRACYVQEKN